jgi:site-specific DNA recombinase
VKKYFAYIRVSTEKQGEHGVSLHEQREILQRYASLKGLGIAQWFEEKETASKLGRPIFNAMLKLLKKGSAAGVIIHKVDRGARNFRDWAEIGELVQAGIEVHFATEALDLTTLGGMLSADLQAVMSVHYSRNLREEVKKGYYGRLKQGLCPYPAPLGYVNNGEGKPKTVDPVQGPIVRNAFELYASGRYSLETLAEEVYRLGLRTRQTPKKPGGMRVSRNTIADLLSNPFYFGVLRVKKTNRTFPGIHDPLVSKALFDRVQQVKSGKYVRQFRVHRFLFSRLITCASCGRALIGESHKGKTYYRCHKQHTKPVGLRDDQIADQVSAFFRKLRLSREEEGLIDEITEHMRTSSAYQSRQIVETARMSLIAVEQKIDRVTDAYVDGLLSKEELELKKTALILERQNIERQVSDLEGGKQPGQATCDKIVELIKTAHLLYENGSDEEKRQLIKEVMSNCTVSAKTLDITVRFPFAKVAKHHDVRFGGPVPGRGRKFWTELLNQLVMIVQGGQSPRDLPLAA